MLKKILVASCLIVTSMASQATIISHYGYERDSASNIVTGGGLEWLMWDVTKDQSINEALSTYASDGWSLATNANMAELFNAFQFGKTDWNDEENMWQLSEGIWDPEEMSSHKDFVSLFGPTYNGYPLCDTVNMDDVFYCDNAEDVELFTSAYYGSDSNQSGFYNQALIWDDYSGIRGMNPFEWGSYAALSDDWISMSEGFGNQGVALVRSVAVEPKPVSLPGSLSLLALGLVALGFRRRQALRR